MMLRIATLVALCCAVLPTVGCGGDTSSGRYQYQGTAPGIDGAIFSDTASMDTSAAADTAAGSDTSSDGETSPDMLATDTANTTDASDAAGTDTGGPAKCSGNDKSCADGTTPQFCSQGQWLKLEACGAGYKCEQGACACAKECIAIGQRECIGTIDAYRECKLVDGCLRYQVPQACKPGFLCVQGGCIEAPTECKPACPQGHTCSKGKCIPPSACTPACSAGQICDQGSCVGTLSCGQVSACVNQYSSGPNDSVNINACVGKGTAAAQALYKKRKDCIALTCQTLIDGGKNSEAALCIYAKCGQEQTACIGSGTATCNQLGNCLSGCGSSATCFIECHASASLDSVKAWYTLATCGEQSCAGKTGDAYAQCAVQLCKGPFENCFGPTSTGGTYTCKQIFACLATNQCTTKACADGCKQQASAQGLADLQALLDCQNKYCASYCNSTDANCKACIKAVCAAQDAKCGYAS